MKTRIPMIKKKVNAFLLGETGKISKKTLYKTGMVLSSIAIGAELAARDVEAGHNSHNNHSNNYDPNCSGCQAPDNGVCHDSSVNLKLDDLKMNAVAKHDNCLERHSNSHSNYDYTCCVPAGTLVSLPGNKAAKIEDIKPGEEVLTYNLERKQAEAAMVNDMHKPVREGIYKLNDGELMITNDHPMWVQKDDGYTGWAAIDPELTKKTCPHLTLRVLEKGDKVFHLENGWVDLRSIKYIQGDIQTYSLKSVTKNHNFFVNGYLTHNKGGWC